MGSESAYKNPDHSDKPLEIGDTFFEGRFHLVEPTDTGDFSVAWVAHDPVLHNQATLKYLLDCTKLDNKELADFCEETKWTLFRHHPNIVRVFELQSQTGAEELIKHLIAHGSRDSDRKVPFFEVAEIEEWIGLLCQSLLRVHLPAINDSTKNGVDEVYLREDKRQEFAFEVSSKVTRTIERLTGVRSIFTTAYGSPEQALGSPLDEKQDVYAVGALIYDLLTSKPPFFHGDVLSQIQQVSPPAMSARRRELGCKGNLIPQRWEDAVAACLAKNPAHRPDFKQLLALLFEDSGSLTGRKTFRFTKFGIIALTGLCLTGLSIHAPRDKDAVASSPTKSEQNKLLALPEMPTIAPHSPTLAVNTVLPILRPVISRGLKISEPPRIQIGDEDEEEFPPVRAERIFASVIPGEPKPLPLRPALMPADPPPAPVAVDEAPEKPPVQNGETFELESIGMKMVWIPPLNAWVARSEVTRNQFAAFGEKVRSRFKGENLPVDSVSWYQAMAFCEKLTASEQEAGRLPSGLIYTLPTEQQWQTYVGDAGLNHAYHGRSGSAGPVEPGSLPENNYGLVDVRGNLWEWTLDDYSSDPGKGKALRGGSYATRSFLVMDENARFYGKKDVSYYQYGFRFILTPGKPEGN